MYSTENVRQVQNISWKEVYCSFRQGSNDGAPGLIFNRRWTKSKSVF
jgi:hypothetical protein